MHFLELCGEVIDCSLLVFILVKLVVEIGNPISKLFVPSSGLCLLGERIIIIAQSEATSDAASS